METIIEYSVYAAAFIAVVLAIEGLVRVLRGLVGEERTIKRRLARAQPLAAHGAEPGEAREPDRMSRLVIARVPWIGATLDRAGSPLTPAQFVIGVLVVFMLLLFVLNLAGVPALLVIALAGGLSLGGAWALLSGMVARRRKRFLDQMPQAVDLIARSLQAGHPVATAMSVVGQRMHTPLGPEFKIVIEEMTYGLDRDSALGNLLTRFPLPELRMFVACLEITRETGGNLAEVFLKLAEQIRAKAQFRKKVHAISAEGRMSFWVVTALPFVVGGALMLIRPSFYLEVVGDSLFWPLMSMSPVCLAIGAVMIWRMVNVKV